jgi:hypothetical protein
MRCQVETDRIVDSSRATPQLYDDLVDRLDSWLNRQIGWRQAVLMWVHLCPPAAMIGFGLWGLLGPGSPEPGLTFVKVGAVSVLAAVPVAVILVSARHVRVARIGGKPAFLWRASAALLLWSGALILNLAAEQLEGWSRFHHVIAVATLLLMIGAFGFFISSWFQSRRLAAARG